MDREFWELNEDVDLWEIDNKIEKEIKDFFRYKFKISFGVRFRIKNKMYCVENIVIKNGYKIKCRNLKRSGNWAKGYKLFEYKEVLKYMNV